MTHKIHFGWPLFDHLVSPQQNRLGYGKTERLGGLEVHGHLELGRKLNGKVRWPRLFEQKIRVAKWIVGRG